MSKQRIEDLEQQIADLKKRWPAHSVPPAMMAQLDELEDQLRCELEKAGNSPEDTQANPTAVCYQPIGHVENEFAEPASPDQIRSVESRIVLDPSLVEGLKGLEPGQQIMVIFFFHLSEGYELLQHPMGDQSQPQRGVFALHSPRRPNPIGVTIADLVAIEGNVLIVRGLDAIDGTPVLDLKLA
jgi:tRNA (adenine37-N6)-methyltransferase